MHSLHSLMKSLCDGGTIVGNVGLLFVGAVLFLNGVMLRGWVEAKSAAPINFFAGVVQVVTLSYLILTPRTVMADVCAARGVPAGSSS
jgi:hypothetical protein